MWITNEDGFFSTVLHKDDHDKVLIRARVDSDLDNLIDHVREAIDLPDTAFERSVDKSADYHYRLILDRTVWRFYLSLTVDDMEYDTSVKDAIDQGSKDRHNALMDVWSAMARLQPEKPWSGKEELSPGERACLDDLWDDVNKLYGGNRYDESWTDGAEVDVTELDRVANKVIARNEAARTEDADTPAFWDALGDAETSVDALLDALDAEDEK